MGDITLNLDLDLDLDLDPDKKAETFKCYKLSQFVSIYNI